jgi:hypothetical protein
MWLVVEPPFKADPTETEDPAMRAEYPEWGKPAIARLKEVGEDEPRLPMNPIVRVEL